MPDIFITNRSSLSDDEVHSYVDAIQQQVSRDFTPAWGIDALLHFVEGGKTPPKDSDSVALLDDTLSLEALSVTLSQDILQRLVDPTNASVSASLAGRQYALEVCGPCCADEYGYEIDGILVSDFCFPAYFGLNASSRFDFMNKLSRPAPAILPGGHVSFFADGMWLTTAARFRDGSLSPRVHRENSTSQLRARTEPGGIQEVSTPRPQQDVATQLSPTPLTAFDDKSADTKKKGDK